ncbi:MAG: toll/interleukin-1 receptor domain-containing protein [Bacteriovoracales bacterium]|nr:toll/interleukin-1 receptor domain-containing protein [Bacteriovoracales bacterium]
MNRYNFLIHYSSDNKSWENSQPTVQYTYDSYRIPSKDGNIPDIHWLNQLLNYPCLFGYEDNRGFGRIGKIVQLSQEHRNIKIEYQIDQRYLIPMSTYYQILNIHENQIRTSRWQLMDGDIFEAISNYLLDKNGHDSPSSDEMLSIWGDNYMDKHLIFLSHRVSNRHNVSIKLKTELEKSNIKCFVAHDDIIPGSVWEQEILNALRSTHFFVAIITDDFHESSWTNQEIGYACSKKIPRISLKVGGSDPQGFMASKQAITVDWDNAPQKIIEWMQKELERIHP